MNLYKVHYLPVLHLDLNYSFFCFRRSIPSSLKHGMYTMLPTEDNIHICVATQGYLCMMNQTLYPVEHTEWCKWSLFIHECECINIFCLVNSKLRHANITWLLVLMDGYGQFLVGKNLQIGCLTDIHVIHFLPLLQTVNT